MPVCLRGEQVVADPEGFPQFPLKPPFELVVNRMCIKRGRVATVHMRMKPPFPNPGSATGKGRGSGRGMR